MVIKREGSVEFMLVQMGIADKEDSPGNIQVRVFRIKLFHYHGDLASLILVLKLSSLKKNLSFYE
jgi:hypothetical protein